MSARGRKIYAAVLVSSSVIGWAEAAISQTTRAAANVAKASSNAPLAARQNLPENLKSFVIPQEPPGLQSEAPAFDWHRHINLSPNFTREVAAALSLVLDDISRAHDGDGRELIMKAGMRNCGKLNFVPGGTNYYDDTKPEIQISFRDAGRTVYKENGVERLASLNGILVHELFHAADPNPTNLEVKQYVADRLNKLLSQYGYKEAEKKEINSEIGLLIKQKTARYFVNGLVTEQLQRVLHIVSIKNQGFPKIGEMIEKIPKEKFQETLIEEGIVGRDGTRPWEARAVAYTDAFMKKNYGDQEPMRGNYSNGKLMDTVRPITILSRSPVASTGNNFPAEPQGTDLFTCTMPAVKSASSAKLLNSPLSGPQTIKSSETFATCQPAVQFSCRALALSDVAIPQAPMPTDKGFRRVIIPGLSLRQRTACRKRYLCPSNPSGWP